jgi:hypothetical protein
LHAQAPDRRIDPGLGAAEVWLGAGADNGIEAIIASDFETGLANGAREPARQVKVIERKDSALFGIDPIDLIVVPPLGHGKDAKGVGAQQHLRGDLMGRGPNALGRVLILLQSPVATRRSSQRMS